MLFTNAVPTGRRFAIACQRQQHSSTAAQRQVESLSKQLSTSGCSGPGFSKLSKPSKVPFFLSARPAAYPSSRRPASHLSIHIWLGPRAQALPSHWFVLRGPHRHLDGQSRWICTFFAEASCTRQGGGSPPEMAKRQKQIVGKVRGSSHLKGRAC